MAEYDTLLSHASFLTGLARALVQDIHAAEDLIQDTWTAALKKPPTDPTTARAWLVRTMRNRAT